MLLRKNDTDMIIQPGIYDIDIEEYHASQGISRSGIIAFKRSPKHYWDAYLRQDRKNKPSSPSKDFGAAFHPYILEPELFKRDFCYEDLKVDGRTTAGRLYRKEFALKNQGKTILTFDNYERLLEMVKSIHEDNISIALLDGAQVEKSIYWVDPDTGVLCKCRPDVLQLYAGTIGDLKSTKDANPEKFLYSVKEFGYHIQAAMQIDGIHEVFKKTIDRYVFICTESTSPYVTNNILLSDNRIQEGREIYKRELIKYKECLEKNEWPGYPNLQVI